MIVNNKVHAVTPQEGWRIKYRSVAYPLFAPAPRIYGPCIKQVPIATFRGFQTGHKVTAAQQGCKPYLAKKGRFSYTLDAAQHFYVASHKSVLYWKYSIFIQIFCEA